MRTHRVLTLVLLSLPSLAWAQAVAPAAELPQPPEEATPVVAPPPESFAPPPDHELPAPVESEPDPSLAQPVDAPVLLVAPAPIALTGNVPVRLVSTNRKVTFYGRTFDPPSEPEELCKTPCELSLPAGPYELSLTDGTVDPVKAGRFEVKSGGTVLTSFVSRDRVRRAGLGVLALSALLGSTFTLLASSCDTDLTGAEYCEKEKGFRVTGITFLSAGVVAGLVMVLMPDKARLEWLHSL